MQTRIKTYSEIEAMRISGQMLATVLTKLKDSTIIGMSTKDLAEIAKNELRVLGGQPTFLGFHGFPDVLCTSVNDEVVHGIPSHKKILVDGDIVSLDFGVTYRGMITDSAITFIIGTPQPRDVKLVKTTLQSLEAAIDIIKNGVSVGDIGNKVQQILDKAGYGIVRDLVGHGVGHELHEEPNIPNLGNAGSGQKLKSGMTIAVEPMATLGNHKIVTDKDGWTVRTSDGSRSAHFEHTILITEKGAEVITQLN